MCHQYILHIKFTMILSCCMQLKCSERTKIHIKLIFVNLTVSKLNVALCADISDKFKDSMATCSTHDFVPVWTWWPLTCSTHCNTMQMIFQSHRRSAAMTTLHMPDTDTVLNGTNVVNDKIFDIIASNYKCKKLQFKRVNGEMQKTA